ncbi:MAG: metal-dependent hydrolase [Leptospiraceae bacterium]|nr:metal-dependent hydrolase [Leptospiraceae bacterium]
MKNSNTMQMQETGKSSKTMPIVRRTDFQHGSATPRYWFKGNALATHFNNAMHMVFPDGEQLFIRSVRAFANEIQDENLKERVKAFIGQEVQHGLEHKKFWQILESQGLKPGDFAKWFNQLAFENFEPLGIKVFGKSGPLAVTAALEHYTAIMAEMAFQKDSELFEGLPEEMKNMLLWHAAEEIEHKAVAFDVLKKVDDSDYIKIMGMLVASAGLWFFVFSGMLHFMRNDKELGLTKILQDIPDFLFGQKKLAGSILDRLFDYFRSDFHPDDHNSLELVQNFLNSGKIPLKEKLSA